MRDSNAGWDRFLGRVRQHVVYGPAHVGAHCAPKRRIGGQSRVVQRENETIKEPLTEIAHVAVTGMHPEDAGLVSTGLRVRRGSAHHLSPISSQTFDVLGMLIIVRKRMIELRIGEAPCMMGPRQSKKCSLPAGELKQGRKHVESLAHDTLRCFKLFRVC